MMHDPPAASERPFRDGYAWAYDMICGDKDYACELLRFAPLPDIDAVLDDARWNAIFIARSV